MKHFNGLVASCCLFSGIINIPFWPDPINVFCTAICFALSLANFALAVSPIE